MVFTSYYAQMRNFSENIVPVSISRGTPGFFTGAKMIELAPPAYVLAKFKEEQSKNPTPEKMAEIEAWYTEEYSKHLEKLGIEKLQSLIESVCPDDNYIWDSKEKHVALLCYEKSGDFCHRRILSSYLREHGLPCVEVPKDQLLKMKNELIEQSFERECEM